MFVLVVDWLKYVLCNSLLLKVWEGTCCRRAGTPTSPDPVLEDPAFLAILAFYDWPSNDRRSFYYWFWDLFIFDYRNGVNNIVIIMA